MHVYINFIIFVQKFYLFFPILEHCSTISFALMAFSLFPPFWKTIVSFKVRIMINRILSNSFSRKICKSIEICKNGAKAINHDEGIYTLDHVNDSLLKLTLHPWKETAIIGRFPGKRSELKHDQTITQDDKSISLWEIMYIIFGYVTTIFFTTILQQIKLFQIYSSFIMFF